MILLYFDGNSVATKSATTGEKLIFKHARQWLMMKISHSNIKPHRANRNSTRSSNLKPKLSLESARTAIASPIWAAQNSVPLQ
jgi:hypothetical protein